MFGWLALVRLGRLVVSAIGLVIAAGVGAQANPAAGVTPILSLADEARTYDIVGNADVLDDPSGNVDIDDIAGSSSFRPAASDSQPSDDGIRWYRFRVRVPAGTHARWYLTTSRHCDDAELYQPRPSGYSLKRFGYRVPFAGRPAPGVSPATRLESLDGRALFVRLRCNRGRQVLVLRTEAQSDRSLPAEVVRTFDSGLIALTVLAAGLAIVTRSPAFAYASAGGALAVFGANTIFLNRWLPNVAFPPAWLVFVLISALWAITQFFYYDRFLELREHPRWRYVLLTALAISVFGHIAWTFAPLRWQNTILGGYIFNAIWDAIVIAAVPAAIVFARRGNRSAWFAASGGSIFLLGGVLEPASDVFGFPALVGVLAGAFPYAPDLLLLILGVGDRLRQTALARERALEEKDGVQSALVAEQRRNLTESERRNASFARFVPSEFLHQLGKAEIVDVGLGDHTERDMAVLFADIRSFTSLAERLSPSATFAFLNEYLARVGPLIRTHGGFIDKYVGDAIVALFPGTAGDALDAALALQNEVRRLNEDRARRGQEPIAIGIGINFGRVVLGTIGEAERIETTVISDAVNVASRLEGLTKVYGAFIIASESLVDALPDRSAYGLRTLGEVALRGLTRSAEAYECFGSDPHALILHKRRTLESFLAALAHYRAGEYARSRDLFAQIAEANGLDRAALYLRDRSSVMAGAAATSNDS